MELEPVAFDGITKRHFINLHDRVSGMILLLILWNRIVKGFAFSVAIVENDLAVFLQFNSDSARWKPPDIVAPTGSFRTVL